MYVFRTSSNAAFFNCCNCASIWRCVRIERWLSACAERLRMGSRTFNDT